MPTFYLWWRYLQML